ncbi:putative abhydrolase domain-containing protein [Abeliophyllum distichum]|uniref:Abhydrolase domain-containing protein n=1 Tax=Abeliophyllum distichum TaxID=126358 RepID=A0ABD1SA73_9LAMI
MSSTISPCTQLLGDQAFRKYFSAKWDDFAAHGEEEDIMEAIFATALQVDLKEFESNVLVLTKKLDYANTAKRIASEALEVANKDKRKLKEECDSYELEVTRLKEAEACKVEADRLKESLEAYEKGRKELEVKLENAETEFVANFHNTNAYTDFSDFFAKVGHQEVLAALRFEHPELDISFMEAKFPSRQCFW